MNAWRWVDPRVASVRLAAVRDYLVGRGWQLSHSPNPNLLRFEKPGEANGKPLYYFTPDIQAGNKKMATGDELKTFGSIWHIVKG